MQHTKCTRQEDNEIIRNFKSNEETTRKKNDLANRSVIRIHSIGISPENKDAESGKCIKCTEWERFKEKRIWCGERKRELNVRVVI